MSIYIPGMEMPKSCDECYFLGELGACDVLLAMNKKAEDRCPLIEVPPHGRFCVYDGVIVQNDAEPTIIPADGADKEET